MVSWGLRAKRLAVEAAAGAQPACSTHLRPRSAVALAAGLLVSLLIAPLHAQSYPRQYISTVWQTDQGLPQNSVNAMVQDHEGYLWIGTFGGLARFDGMRFTVLSPAETQDLSDRILSLYVSRSGVLWVGTLEGGLARLHNGVAAKYTERDGLPSGFISSIREDAEGKMWINTALGVAHFAGTKLEAYVTHRGKAVSEFYLQERDGSMWFHSGGDIVRFGTDGSTAALTVAKTKGFLVHEARDGSVLIAFPDQYRLVRYHQGVFSDLQLPPIGRRRFTGTSPEQGVLAVAVDTDGETLLLTPVGFVRFADGRLSPPEALPWPASDADLPKVRSLLIDREGNRWVGTIGTGLVRFRRAPLTAYGKEEALSDSSFSAVFQDSKGRIWLGGDLLYWFDGRDFHLLPGVVDVRAIAETTDGDLWFGGYGGLHRWRSGVLRHFKLEAPAVRAILQDQQGTLWIGAAMEERPGGLFRFHKGKFEQIPGASDVREIFEDGNGRLWLGGLHGIRYVRAGRTVPYEETRDLSVRPQDIYQDSTGTLWVATYGGGLNRFRNGRLKAITTKDGLPNNMLLCILEDGEGNLWISSNHNIFRLSLKELNDFADGKTPSILPVSFGIGEGMRSSECNGGSPGGWKSADGRLWFPTLRGVVAIDPAALNHLPPPVVLEEAQANKLTLERGARTSVPPGNNTFDFRFTALSFSAPEKVRFKYRLEPYDKDWVDAGTRRTAQYMNMPPGEYSFRVIAANSYGVWNDRGASVRFVLEPHIYQTWWFYLLAAAGVVLCAISAYRLRIRQLRARERQLEQLVDSRTVELRTEIEAREEVESSLRQARAELEDRVVERTSELRESEQRFRTFVDHAADALFVLDLEQGTVFDVNREACASLGRKREELIGKDTLAFDVGLDRATIESIAERAAKGETVSDIHWHRRKDGSLFPVEVRTSLVPYGGRRFLLKMARDISDRVRSEEQREKLRHLESELAHLHRVSMMGEMSASIAHEVNQPLSGIVSNANACLRWLGRDVPNLEEAREAASRIVRDGKRAGEVIARIRALTRRAETPREKLNLNETIREVLVLIADQAKKESVWIQTRFADDLSPVSADRVQLQQVVLNLVMNAIEAMSATCEGARELAIRTQNVDGDQVQVTVEDSGPGLDPTQTGRVFDPFYTTKPGGMGMGLSISRSILESHGGRLWASPKDGPGTSFHFTLAKHHEEGQVPA